MFPWSDKVRMKETQRICAVWVLDRSGCSEFSVYGLVWIGDMISALFAFRRPRETNTPTAYATNLFSYSNKHRSNLPIQCKTILG